MAGKPTAVDCDETDQAILKEIALGLIGVPSTEKLVEALGFPSVRAFCNERGCQNLIEYFFSENFVQRLGATERELASRSAS